ncbi:uncharacterized protein M421DRAFT_352967 [Didymella exigua CBS 183.55]|uniref:Uncharacterized protein n=1 Tax=Didymella exigua CBS 183.55 TaxID=1150837 RepID=A0A6A5R7A8_9PLEO|nr:uncharacterized protein M421DRAFT_352967 [Didymella exigua CBS 183.55]KAF1922596.1 hypothetical protein M421DRAFT_352967 [Didymella exigua CBS 183.55]
MSASDDSASLRAAGARQYGRSGRSGRGQAGSRGMAGAGCSMWMRGLQCVDVRAAVRGCAGCNASGAGFKASDAGFTASDAGFKALDAGFKASDAGFEVSDVGFEASGVGAQWVNRRSQSRDGELLDDATGLRAPPAR